MSGLDPLESTAPSSFVLSLPYGLDKESLAPSTLETITKSGSTSTLRNFVGKKRKNPFQQRQQEIEQKKRKAESETQEMMGTFIESFNHKPSYSTGQAFVKSGTSTLVPKTTLYQPSFSSPVKLISPEQSQPGKKAIEELKEELSVDKGYSRENRYSSRDRERRQRDFIRPTRDNDSRDSRGRRDYGRDYERNAQGETNHITGRNDRNSERNERRLVPPPQVAVVPRQVSIKEEKIEKTLPKKELTSEEEEKVTKILENLSASRMDILMAMGTLFTYTESYEKICHIIHNAITKEGVLLHRKIALLYLISDLLYNSSTVKKASIFRNWFQLHLISIFRAIAVPFCAITGRISAKNVQDRILRVTKAWNSWALYPPAFLIELESFFITKRERDISPPRRGHGPPPPSANREKFLQQLRDNAKLAELELAQKKQIYNTRTLQTDVDGIPITNIDGIPIDDLDGIPIDEIDGIPMDDIDGVPLCDDIDGIPMEEEENGISSEEGDLFA